MINIDTSLGKCCYKLVSYKITEKYQVSKDKPGCAFIFYKLVHMRKSLFQSGIMEYYATTPNIFIKLKTVGKYALPLLVPNNKHINLNIFFN